MRVDGLAHNLFTVLLIPGFPTSFIGLVALPFFVRLAALGDRVAERQDARLRGRRARRQAGEPGGDCSRVLHGVTMTLP